MDINRANMDLFFTQVRTEFTNGLNAKRENLILNKIGMQVPSTTAITTHGWLNQIPSMKKWVGPRTAENLQSAKLAITNAKFVNTIEIERTDFEDDQYGLYVPTFGLMGQDAMAVKDRVLVDALLQGTSTTWADGVAVFSNAGRAFDGTNAIDNYDTTAYDAAGVALAAAYAKMTAYLGHGGVPLMVQPRYILHGPSLRVKVQQSLSTYGALLAANGSTYVGGQIANPNAQLVTPVETPYLVNGYVDMDGTTYANAGTYWFVLGEIAGIRGLVYQSRIEPEMQDQRARLDSEFLFEFDKIQWGFRARGAGFVGLPHLVYGSFATT